MRTPIQALSARTLSWVLAVLALFAALPVLGAVLTVTPASGGTGASVTIFASKAWTFWTSQGIWLLTSS